MFIPIWVLIVVGLAIYMVNTEARKRVTEPFQISVAFNWHELLHDYKIVTDKAVWKKLDEDVSKISGYHVFKDGITFTVLQRSQSEEIIFSDNHKSFGTRVDFVEPLKEIHLPSEMPNTMYFPYVYVKTAISKIASKKSVEVGYEIGIATPESIQKDSEISGERPGCIKVAFLPYSGLGLYKYEKLSREQRIKNLKDYSWDGWLDQDEPLPGERNPAFHFSHKYFNVYLTYI
jgi:hypothetical protein